MHEHPLTISGIPRDLKSTECRVAWATEEAYIKENLGKMKEEQRPKAMADALKRSVLKLGLELDEKVFSKEELEAMDRVDPDYIAHLIANPEELKKAIESAG